MNYRNRKRILLADNRREYRRSVIGFLELEGYVVTEVETPEQALGALELEEFDLALVDLRMREEEDLNDMSGLEVAKFASTLNIPCIIVTAFPTVELARIALRSRGAEPFAKDLITKASGPQALVDSISLILKYTDLTSAKSVENGLLVDVDKKLIWKNGEIIKLSKNQYSLMVELNNKDGGVCSYKELIKAIYDEDLTAIDAQNDKRFRNLVDRTKEKIEDMDSSHEYIAAVAGMGYRLNLKK